MQRQQAKAIQDARNTSIKFEEKEIPKVNTFCYLGRVLAANNSDWPAVYKNL
jgi:hypothetical protein